jgi:hypothetical protein
MDRAQHIPPLHTLVTFSPFYLFTLLLAAGREPLTTNHVFAVGECLIF